MRSALFVIIQCLLLLSSGANGSTSATTSSKQGALQQLGLVGTLPDPFVAASPLLVAAVCADGIAMVATHTVSAKERLLRSDCLMTDDNNDNNKKNDKEPDKDEGPFHDLLIESGGGPYRIQSIGSSATTSSSSSCHALLLAAGWRADCDLLSAKVRSLLSKETAVFGPSKWGLPMARQLAQETSWWMTQCATSESMRPLSCVGLLVGCADKTPEGGDNKDSHVGSLWFVDASGAYRLRALAIGGGKLETPSKKDADKSSSHNEGNSMVAQQVNALLQQINFADISAEDGVRCIVKILQGYKRRVRASSTDNGGSIEWDEEEGVARLPLVAEGCELELAISGRQDGMHRLSLGDIQ